MHFIHLHVFACDDPHSRTDGGAIALGSNQLDLDPVLLVAAVVVKQRRQVVHVQNQHVHAAVVVVIAECCTAAGETRADSGSHLRGNIFESAVAEILVHQPRILESLAEVVAYRSPDRRAR